MRGADQVTVRLPDEQTVKADVDRIRVQTDGNSAATRLRAVSPALNNRGLFASGTPVNVDVALRKDGLVRVVPRAPGRAADPGRPPVSTRVRTGVVAVAVAALVAGIAVATGSLFGGESSSGRDAFRPFRPTTSSGWTPVTRQAPPSWTPAAAGCPGRRATSARSGWTATSRRPPTGGTPGCSSVPSRSRSSRCRWRCRPTPPASRSGCPGCPPRSRRSPLRSPPGCGSAWTPTPSPPPGPILSR